MKKANKFRKTTDWMLNLVLKMNDSLDVTEMAQQLCLVETVSLLLIQNFSILFCLTLENRSVAEKSFTFCGFTDPLFCLSFKSLLVFLIPLKIIMKAAAPMD